MRTVDELSSCPFTSEQFSSHLSLIQKTIDKLNLEGYANLDSWVHDLDNKIESVLIERVKHIIEDWCITFDRTPEDLSIIRSNQAREIHKKKSKNEIEICKL